MTKNNLAWNSIIAKCSFLRLVSIKMSEGYIGYEGLTVVFNNFNMKNKNFTQISLIIMSFPDIWVTFFKIRLYAIAVLKRTRLTMPENLWICRYLNTGQGKWNFYCFPLFCDLLWKINFGFLRSSTQLIHKKSLLC